MSEATLLEYALPRICKRCLITNPDKSMEADPQGAVCRLCSQNFSVFGWRTTQGKNMRTLLCINCATQKDICQVCALDVEYGIPHNVKAYALKVLTEEGGDRRDQDLVKKVMEAIAEDY